MVRLGCVLIGLTVSLMLAGWSVAPTVRAQATDPCTGALADSEECALANTPEEIADLQAEASAFEALPIEDQPDNDVPEPESVRQPGLITDRSSVGLGPLPRGMFVPVNAWNGLSGILPVSVWAGASEVDPSIGMIAVSYYGLDGDLERVVAITAPGSPGALSIQPSLIGDLTGLLTVVGENAQTFLYNALLNLLIPTSG